MTRDDGWDAAMDGVDHVLHVASPLGSTGKALHLLGWRPRPAADTVVDCARSLIAWQLV